MVEHQHGGGGLALTRWPPRNFNTPAPCSIQCLLQAIPASACSLGRGDGSCATYRMLSGTGPWTNASTESAGLAG